VTDDRDTLRIDVLPFHQPSRHGSRVVGVITDRRRFRTAAALAKTALVVTHRDDAGIGERARELTEDRHAKRVTVAIAEHPLLRAG
jgi:hypothetical protein